MVQLIMKTLMVFFVLMFCMTIGVEAADSSFTQADRDRMTRLEEGLKATNQKIDDGLKAVNQRIDDGLKAVNQRIDSVNQRIDDLRGLIYVMISVTVSGMLFIVGFALWDRRTILAPLTRTTRELEAHTEKLTLAIKAKAEKDPELKEALRHAGLL
ncbi:MAG: hypothetical protein HQL05_07090 [Nitrospirae bacterium]|uniref:hypothetical protein n=1 Tax=Candidatus Magnetobacterium casense TaxID=1455061 RepID=UPI000590C4D6|nr:hypothetical protein [Candidatus Magnetobacterium casensis]MBF0337585.1 hypothetical protein [Nitrospirota bacterium]